MCWRDEVLTNRHCILCGALYYGDLGHRNCPARVRPPSGAKVEEKPVVAVVKDEENAK